jgi:hypothetical protein
LVLKSKLPQQGITAAPQPTFFKVVCSSVGRVADRLRVARQPLRTGLWIVSVAALLYSATLLTRGRTEREWMSPPRPGAVTASAEPVVAAAPAWADLPPAPRVPAEASAPEASSVAEAPREAAAGPVTAPAAVPAATTLSRGMSARRASRRAASRRAREPIQFRLADRPGM